jgi:pSer/pThr/pTyr-binding forkhead associated (FHA) protein
MDEMGRRRSEVGLPGDTGELESATPVLTLRVDEGRGPHDFHVRGGSGTIGRSPECDVCLEDDLVSRRHAKVQVQGGKWRIEDLGSTNGTWVNEDRLTTSVALARGDRLRLGNATLHVQAGDLLEPRVAAAAPAPASGGVSFEVPGHQSGHINMAGRDLHDHSLHHYEDRSQTNYYGDNPFLMIFHASGAAKVLMIVGMFLSLAGVGCWGYPIVRAVTEGFSQPAGSFDPPEFHAIPWLPLGAGLAFGGSLILLIGMAMARRDRR